MSSELSFLLGFCVGGLFVAFISLGFAIADEKARNIERNFPNERT